MPVLSHSWNGALTHAKIKITLENKQQAWAGGVGPCSDFIYSTSILGKRPSQQAVNCARQLCKDEILSDFALVILSSAPLRSLCLVPKTPVIAACQSFIPVSFTGCMDSERHALPYTWPTVSRLQIPLEVCARDVRTLLYSHMKSVPEAARATHWRLSIHIHSRHFLILTVNPHAQASTVTFTVMATVLLGLLHNSNPTIDYWWLL